MKRIVTVFLFLLTIQACNPGNSGGTSLITFTSVLGNYSGVCGNINISTSEITNSSSSVLRVFVIDTETIGLDTPCSDFDGNNLRLISEGSEGFEFVSLSGESSQLRLNYFAIQDSISITSSNSAIEDFFGGHHD